ncbi:phage antirepressor N-terminal domain-containing protein [Pseudomonas resinovorans]|uniref:phage antirepressor N-terminal domain-containing protein n=1 Tax=Metapseudomonas resinovorans TaxID=53412 RepID=UPI00237F8D6C|nr:phage antirepressor N-terminal domain-containing protein [Pseudomonas resinovorans]MDE3738589.1 phage antirepressor N-terminal domain-containing protein [Pseudomonas resinovorans]
MNTAQQLIPVPFYEDTVVLVGQDNEPFVAMKPIVTNMGLVWAAQYVKLMERFSSTISEIETVADDGKMRSMTCMPLRKLPAWLYSISPNKVKPELRDKIIRYQEECDDALWAYWTQGSAQRPGSTAVTQRIALSRHRLALAKELHRTRDKALRGVIHQQLDEVSRAMGLPTPELDSLGRATPDAPDLLTRFWEQLAFLDDKRVDYNHAIDPGLLAINLVHLAKLLQEHGQPFRPTRPLHEALRQSSAPQFLDHKPVFSRLTRKSIRCWVFERG